MASFDSSTTTGGARKHAWTKIVINCSIAAADISTQIQQNKVNIIKNIQVQIIKDPWLKKILNTPAKVSVSLLAQAACVRQA